MQAVMAGQPNVDFRAARGRRHRADRRDERRARGAELSAARRRHRGVQGGHAAGRSVSDAQPAGGAAAGARPVRQSDRARCRADEHRGDVVDPGPDGYEHVHAAGSATAAADDCRRTTRSASARRECRGRLPHLRPREPKRAARRLHQRIRAHHRRRRTRIRRRSRRRHHPPRRRVADSAVECGGLPPLSSAENKAAASRRTPRPIAGGATALSRARSRSPS